MRYFAVAAVMIVAACAAQNTPTPGPDEDALGDGGESHDQSVGGKTSSGGSLPTSGTTTGGAAAGGKASNGGKTSTAGASDGGAAGAGSDASAGAGGDNSPAGGSGGSGGKAGSGGSSGGGGSAGAGCKPTTSAPLAGISARYEPEEKGASGFSIGSKLIIANQGPNTVNLNDLKLRYYFTNEVTAALTTKLNWSYFRPNSGGGQTDVDKAKITPTLVPMTCTTANADTYIEFTFAADIGNLSPGNQVYFSWVATNTASQSFTQTDDYSFDAAAVMATDDQKLVVLQNSGTRAWGSEP